ncbi:MAG TPA: hypothetical protein GXX38_07165 [Clostridia bacterium]|jgi:Fur family ferric uptake transcriptional regulator|nr:hypothetical protein [Clostridia bacterium]
MNSHFQPTYKRALILKSLRKLSKYNPTAEDIRNLIQERGFDIGLSTVYRNLNTLEKLGIVKKRKLGTEAARYYLVDRKGS